MLTLHLGVIDLPYNTSEGTTTGDVAEILEARYGVMQRFYDAHDAEVADAVAEGMQGTLENLLMGAPPAADPFAAGGARVEHLFHRFLETGEIERLGVDGVPTKAAIQRRSGRFKSKKAKRQRPSFIDTGLYDSSFKAWIEQKDWAKVFAEAAAIYGGSL